MKNLRISSSIAVIGLAAGATCVANAANVLFNGTLDLTALADQDHPTPVGWIVAGNKSLSGTFYDGGDSEPWCNVADPDGFGFFLKPFQGNLAEGDLLTVDLYQDNPATPGTKFTLSGYAAGEANYSGLFATNSPAPQTVFIIYFLNGSGTVIGSNAFDLVSAGLPTGGPGSMSSFLYTTPQVTAPANTATVRAGVSMRNAYGTANPQNFFVDAFDLEAEAPAHPSSPINRIPPRLPPVATRASPLACPTRPGLLINGNSTTPTSPMAATSRAQPRRRSPSRAQQPVMLGITACWCRMGPARYSVLTPCWRSKV